jgi:aminoglycoside 6'-N-acetyltransferase
VADASRISFRAVEARDLKMIRQWAGQPHWLAWWGDCDGSLAEIEKAMDDDATEPLIAMLGSRPVAYVQSFDPHLEDGHPYGDQPFGTLGLDISIGDEADLGKGLGSAIIAALCEVLFVEGAPRLIVDPDPANARAIRAYEKAGFVRFDERASKYGPAVMMARDNPEFSGP